MRLRWAGGFGNQVTGKGVNGELHGNAGAWRVCESVAEGRDRGRMGKIKTTEAAVVTIAAHGEVSLS